MTAEIEPVGSENLDRRAGTLERGLAILELLASDSTMSAGQIAERLGLSRSATYRILGLLRQRGYLDWDGTSDRIALGQRIVTVGMAALASFDPFQAAQAHLRDLSRGLSEAALMAVRDAEQMVYIAHEDVTDHYIAVRRLLGVRRPMHATSLGKAYLSALPIEQVDAIIDRLDMKPLTPTTLTDRAQLRAELDEARTRGYSVDNGENEPDVMCYGAPIRDERGMPICAISVAGPRDRILAKSDVIPQRLSDAALAVSRRLGFTGSTNYVKFGR